jgi:tetratricopeptide (TPR) repeat protein
MISALAEYASVFNATVALAILALLVNLFTFARQAERTRADVIEARFQKAVEDVARANTEVERTEKWSKRREEELTAELDALRAKLSEVLSDSGLTITSLSIGASLKSVAEETRDRVNDLVSKMENVEAERAYAFDADWHLEAAKGYAAQGNWQSAAEYLDKYVRIKGDDFEVQFLRGVAHANARTNPLAALRAYNEAVALLPSDDEGPSRARVFSYRGAMMKRLGRLDESEADLKLAIRFAGDRFEYERDDALYNLACVYAMQGDKEPMLDAISKISGAKSYVSAIRYHTKDYFSQFKDDEDFQKALS